MNAERALLVAAAVAVIALGWAAIQVYKVGVRWRLAAAANGITEGRQRLLYFSAAHCTQCPRQLAVVSTLEGRLGPTLLVEKVDAVAEPALVRKYGVLTVPSTIVIGADGRVRAINYGLTSAEKLIRQIEG